MNDKTLVEMLAGWSDSEFAVAASGEYCEDLKSRIEGVLAKQDDTIEAQATRIEALEAALRDYMSAFGQALEANNIPFSKQQLEADEAARMVFENRGKAICL